MKCPSCSAKIAKYIMNHEGFSETCVCGGCALKSIVQLLRGGMELHEVAIRHPAQYKRYQEGIENLYSVCLRKDENGKCSPLL